MYKGYAGSRIVNVKDEDIPRIAQIVARYNDTMKVSDEDFKWLMTIFVRDVAITHMEININCSTCRMKTLSCFIGYVEYWKEIGKI